MPYDPTGYVETKPLSYEGKICHRAAEIIEEGGWCSGMLESPKGEHCFAGAVLKALGWAGGSSSWNRSADQLSSDVNRIAVQLGFENSNEAIQWNWTATGPEVIARLRSVL